MPILKLDKLLEKILKNNQNLEISIVVLCIKK